LFWNCLGKSILLLLLAISVCMKTYFLELKAFLFSSFWFLPICIIVFWWALSFFWVYLDSSSGLGIDIPYLAFLKGSVDSYRQILSTISSSMISIAGLVFSITLVALTLAAGQFGSRILKNFMKSRLTQVALWSYLATFTYCLLTLRIIRSEDYVDFFPDISIFIALIAALANIILLIFYIHHIALSIQVDTLLKDISAELSENMKKLYKKKQQHKAPNIEETKIKIFEKDIIHYKKSTEISTGQGGYISYINKDWLLNIAQEHDCMIQVLKYSWDFIIHGAPIMRVSSRKMLDIAVIDNINNCIHISKTRSPVWDIKFSLQQMVEIAVRALSPWINDPYTAISSLWRIFSFLSELHSYELPEIILCDSKSHPRLLMEEISYGELVELSLTQIRHYAKKSPFVLRQIDIWLDELAKLPLHTDFKRSIECHQKATKKILSQYSEDFLHYSVWDNFKDVK